ncbi:MAG: lipid-A-disaccharide synthase, partial [Owenweeksia sp.]
YKPDVLILIDYPGFNLRMAEYAHLKGYKVIYYISPQIWAWKQNRVHKIKRTVDRMLCILPFEKDFYARFDYEVDFVGHPLIDAIEGREEFDKEARKKELGLSVKPVIALLPGSRQQEIKTMLPIMLRAALKKKEYQAVVAAAPSQDRSFYEEIIGDQPVSIVEGRTYDLLDITEAALVTSGTATLETALFKVPEVVCYKGSWISYWIARQLVKVDYISLVNLIMDREVVTELIQGDMNVKRIGKELDQCLNGKHRDKLLAEYDQLISKLGGTGASGCAAEIITTELGV